MGLPYPAYCHSPCLTAGAMTFLTLPRTSANVHGGCHVPDWRMVNASRYENAQITSASLCYVDTLAYLFVCRRRRTAATDQPPSLLPAATRETGMKNEKNFISEVLLANVQYYEKNLSFHADGWQMPLALRRGPLKNLLAMPDERLRRILLFSGLFGEH